MYGLSFSHLWLGGTYVMQLQYTYSTPWTPHCHFIQMGFHWPWEGEWKVREKYTCLMSCVPREVKNIMRLESVHSVCTQYHTFSYTVPTQWGLVCASSGNNRRWWMMDTEWITMLKLEQCCSWLKSVAPQKLFHYLNSGREKFVIIRERWRVLGWGWSARIHG